MFKRLSAFLLALVWALALTACGDVSSPPSLPSAKASAAPAESASDAPAQEPESEFLPTAETRQPETQTPETQMPEPQAPESESPAVSEDGWYNTKEEVALYIHLYGRLPGNYVTKRQAEAKGWSGGSVERYTGEGTAIGGSRFGNYEGLLPAREGRTYTECDIDTVGTTSRGAKRVVFSNDGLIYYTGDHYASFELLYGEE